MAESTIEKGKSRNDESKIGKYTMSVAVMLTRVGAHRIRRYEEASLLKPTRTTSGQRLYSDFEVSLVKEIARLQSQGINLPGIKAIMAMRNGGYFFRKSGE